MQLKQRFMNAITTASVFIMAVGPALAEDDHGHDDHGHDDHDGGHALGVPEMDVGQSFVVIAIAVCSLLILRERIMRAVSALR